MARVSKRSPASHLGATPKEVARELRMFSRAARALSSNHPRLINEHPREWVGLYDGKVQATSKSFTGLVASLKRQGIAPEKSIIRYIDPDGRKMIL